MKTCSDCKRELDEACFYKAMTSRDGLTSRCKTCNDLASTRWARANQEKRTAAKYKWLAANPEERAATDARYYAKNKHKFRAHDAVKRAIKRGDLVPLPCCVCGTSENVHAHHDDYSRLLDVVWLCHVHHKERHRTVVLPEELEQCSNSHCSQSQSSHSCQHIASTTEAAPISSDR